MSSGDDDVPVLTPEIVADEQALAELVDAIVYKDREARKWVIEAAVYEDALKGIVDGETWLVVLRIEELQNARWSELLLVIARWAFNEGVKSASQPPGST